MTQQGIKIFLSALPESHHIIPFINYKRLKQYVNPTARIAQYTNQRFVKIFTPPVK